MSERAGAFDTVLQKARRRSEAIAFWKIIVGLCLALFGCRQLYRGYATGQLQICGRPSGCHIVTHSAAPAAFDVAASLYLLGTFLFLPGILLIIYFRLTKTGTLRVDRVTRLHRRGGR
jgi:hypothetical protein